MKTTISIVLAACCTCSLAQEADTAPGKHAAPIPYIDRGQTPEGVVTPLNWIISNRSSFFIDTVGSDFDTELGFFEPGGDLIESDDDDGPGLLSQIFAAGLGGGSHTISVSGFNTTFGDGPSVVVSPTSASGNYSLNLAGFTFANGFVGQGQARVFGIQIRSDPGGQATIADFSTLEPITIACDGIGLDPEIALFNNDTGELIFTNDDGGPGLNSLIQVPGGVLAPGEYIVLVNSFNALYADGLTSIISTSSGTGGFDLFVGQFDEFLAGNIAPVGDTDYYTFDVEAPRPRGVVATTAEPLNIDTVGTLFDTELAVYTEDGDVVEVDDDGGPGLTSQINFDPFDLPPGLYYVAIGGFNTIFEPGFVALVDGAEAFGDYTLSIGPDFTGGVLGYSGDVDWFSFEIVLPGCSVADYAPPYGTLNFSDVLVYLTLFGDSSPGADLAPPFGTFNFSDVLAFLTLFGDGCP